MLKRPKLLAYRAWPLRARLTLWNLSVLAGVVGLFSLYLFIRLDRAILDQVDESLRSAAVQAFAAIDDEGSTLRFEQGEEATFAISRLAGAGFAARLIAGDGSQTEGFGSFHDVPLKSPVPGLVTLGSREAEWRVYTQEIPLHRSGVAGYLQVARSLTGAEAASEDLLSQAVLGLPFMLALAGAGGWFLADRALGPIDKLTRTAQAISEGDLTRRIQHTGPEDEVGRLARTFDAMLDRLQLAFERERRFTADASHELRTPLTAIKGQLDVTLSQPRSANAYEAALGLLEPQVERLIRLSSDLLFITRLGLEAPGSSSHRVNLSDLLEEVIEQTKPVADGNGQRLSAEIPRDLEVLGDADRLIRLFLNLLDNAIKYTPGGGHIAVIADHAASRISVSVSNSGPEIPPEHLPHLFERFYRVDNDRSRKAGGVGLGLSIARDIVRAHQGTLEVQSTVGSGTVFTVRLRPG